MSNDVQDFNSNQSEKTTIKKQNFLRRVFVKLFGFVFGKDIYHLLEYQERLNSLESNINLNIVPLLEYIKERLSISADINLVSNSTIDYFQFEDTYRGKRESIKDSQRNYVKYYAPQKNGFVLDIGCGRGEFLELMKENNITAKGIDCYMPFVQFCNKQGFDVTQGDALTYLNSLEDNSLNGIFMSQVIEHLSTDYAIALIKLAYKKLKKGCVFILETPNPQNLSTYWNFYLDGSHIKPVHYLLVEYWFKSFNYESVERYDNEFSKCNFNIPKISGTNMDNLEQINESIDFINKRIFGYYDYTLIAKK